MKRTLEEKENAERKSFEVGYESTTQFNRGYKRFFGQPPKRDIIRRRLAGPAAVSD